MPRVMIAALALSPNPSPSDTPAAKPDHVLGGGAQLDADHVARGVDAQPRRRHARPAGGAPARCRRWPAPTRSGSRGPPPRRGWGLTARRSARGGATVSSTSLMRRWPAGIEPLGQRQQRGTVAQPRRQQRTRRRERRGWARPWPPARRRQIGVLPSHAAPSVGRAARCRTGSAGCGGGVAIGVPPAPRSRQTSVVRCPAMRQQPGEGGAPAAAADHGRPHLRLWKSMITGTPSSAEPGAQLVLDEVGIVAGDQAAVVDNDTEPRRPRVVLGARTAG